MPTRGEIMAANGLWVRFENTRGMTDAITDVSFSILEGSAHGVVGESGSGKTVTFLAALGLLGPQATIGGEFLFQGEDLTRFGAQQFARIRGSKISMIFQDPSSSLNPVISIGKQLRETIRLHRSMTRAGADREAQELLSLVGIAEPRQRLSEYPHQLSGGMNQRVMIAMAIAGEPDLLVADEPTTALDVTIQAQILDLLNDLRARLGMTLVMITHDLAVVAETCDRISVMYAGRVMEDGPARAVLNSPVHPYTAALLRSIPKLGPRVDRLKPIPGNVPEPGSVAVGCVFAPRCAYVTQRCRAEAPPLADKRLGEGRVACFHPLESTP